MESPHSCHLPMMVVKLADVLQMRGTLKCYQELLKLEMLHEHQPSFFTIFVSHQWLAGAHPDPSSNQFRNLQKALRKVLDGTIRLELDMTSQFLGHQKTLTLQDRALLKDAYVWFDWFSVPQASVKQNGELRAEVQRKANLCIRSIPAYVDACQMFVALVPRMINEKQEELNYFTWLGRGWCRAEMWCKLLSEKSDFPIIVVSAVDDVKFIMPLQWLDCPVHEGQFSYDHDRQEVCEFIKAALTFKLQRLSQKKNLNLFRYYAARYEHFLGLAAPSRTKEEFLSYFRFPSEEVALRPKGMCALACAALSSDVSLVRQLVQMKAPLNSKLPPLVEVDVLPDWTPLHLAAAHSSSTRGLETMSTLLELRSDPNATNRLGHPLLGICMSAAGVDLLVKHAADVNKLSPPTMASPLVLASLRCASSEVFEKFIEFKADVSGSATAGGPCRSRSPRPRGRLVSQHRAGCTCRAVLAQGATGHHLGFRRGEHHTTGLCCDVRLPRLGRFLAGLPCRPELVPADFFRLHLGGAHHLPPHQHGVVAAPLGRQRWVFGGWPVEPLVTTGHAFGLCGLQLLRLGRLAKCCHGAQVGPETTT